MFIKKYLVAFISVLVLLALDAGLAFAGNSILSTSLRKTSADGLNLTFYTKSDSSEKPIVKDKGNNRYVILLPNLTDASGKRPDLRTVADIVSDIDVKTINEGAVSYTKITLTTKKPIKINAETRRTSQSSSELSGMNDIISKVNLINQDIIASKSLNPAQQASSQQTQGLPKMSSVQDILKNKNTIGNNIKPAVEVKKENNPVPIVVSNTVSSHVPANTKSIKNESKTLKDENIKNVRQETVKKIDKIENNIKEAVANNVDVNPTEVQLEEVSMLELEAQPEAPIDMQELAPRSGLHFGLSDMLSSPFALISLFLISAALIMAFILGRMKKSLVNGQDMNASFIEHMNSAIPTRKNDFSQIAQNSDLSWQEKYTSFKTGKTKEQMQKLKAHIGAEPDEDLDIVENISEPVISEPEKPVSLNMFESGVVVSSEDSITKSMKKSLLSGFADDKTLKQTRRNTGLRNRFKAFDKTTVGLERNISELLDTVIKMDEEKPVQKSEMSIKQVQEPVAEQQSSAASNEVKTAQSASYASTPIQRAKEPEAVVATKKKMRIKETRLIDDNKGFYLVDMDDKMALMGRIKDKFTVLKKFDGMDKSHLQVRRDKDNLYMVRTDGYKALVNVESEKMSVFAEL